jgi:hypothetical protein
LPADDKEKIMAMAKNYDKREWTKKYLNICVAVIEVKPEETEEEAWRRHVMEKPAERYAKIRVFHKQSKKALYHQ